ncbi:MAG: hypothetical protein R3324_07705, partial [Halobacteriales archaeon]|nr:hypothetical protein [Halobacteriales archaeon]
ADTGTYAHKLDVLRNHCEAVGREYKDIEKTVVNTVVVRETTDAAHEAYESLMAGTARGPAPRGDYRGAVGTPAEVAAEIEAFGELGVSLFIMKVPKNDQESIDRFIDDVLPTI